MPPPALYGFYAKAAKSAKSANSDLAETPALESTEKDRAVKESLDDEAGEINSEKKEALRKFTLQNDILAAELTKFNNDNKARKTQSLLIFIMVFFWLASAIAVLVFVGLGRFVLSEKVLITLLTTTSINVIGLLVIVANYLFNKSKST